MVAGWDIYGTALLLKNVLVGYIPCYTVLAQHTITTKIRSGRSPVRRPRAVRIRELLEHIKNIFKNTCEV